MLDGSDALRTATKEAFPNAVIQRCLVHKERNIRGKLSKRHWGELARLFKRLREVEGYQAACQALNELKKFQKPINMEAYKSLLEAGEELIGLHHLNVPNPLHRSPLSANAIENLILNTRPKTGRVTRFRAETDQASRWLAYALLEAEKGFRKIGGHQDLRKLVNALALATSPQPTIEPKGSLPLPSAPATAMAMAPIPQPSNRCEFRSNPLPFLLSETIISFNN